ncbi:hypothetical protein SDRG_04496 [Saprolegnia diclina VS20]|uniref:DNA-directed RNA polymerase III subunit RPC9 n=2 Tax=Saprolegnia TaxID=4769 RepID=A0A067BQJ2_SAPPC|nr:hypothetical protein SDRG_04496 [Saprolegnia diclina VS20]XP_012208551.1 hypothetical protein SPRG_13321 [Saprolegnia parasitica CBS 223.65]EQC38066.1 hypothetical protein SDRG_04496 [Saprolegnia diclina VS20]KDO20739.1 hypothetical protein SPRG_13321 [Saprolegnia parasitica CBS 223.65]|eukprot:XP_008608393.1 hypothetical protein SDRG_04496 [Saprolegnia diclina VS20]
MKVLAVSEGPLTNYEVMTLLEERKKNRMERKGPQATLYAERNWVDSKVLKCLLQSCAKHLSEEKISGFLTKIGRFELTHAEKLQFLNHCPSELVDIHLIVEDCASRLDEDQIADLLAIAVSTLGNDAVEV